jgi:CHRD domain
MKHPGVVVTLIVFIAAVSFVLAAQQERGRSLNVQLTGTANSSLYGDPDGKATLKLNLKPNQNEICYELAATGVSGVSTIQIHSGAMDQVGPSVLSFTPATAEATKACATMEHDRVMDMVRNPENYYAIISNGEFPNGALRGQLFK